jgi:peptidoglycan/LPS O-acetylase OafA/YrhL
MNVNKDQIQHSCRNFFTNLFYFNNLYPFGPEGGISSCMGWTWYLANDMQFFLLVPLLAAFFMRQFRAIQDKPIHPVERMIRLYGPASLFVIMQITCTIAIAQHYGVGGIFDHNFSAYVYVKPW